MSMEIKTKEDLRLLYRLQTGKSDEDNHSIEYLQWLEDRLVKNCSISSVSMRDVIFECGTCGDDTSELGFCPKCDTQAHSY